MKFSAPLRSARPTRLFGLVLAATLASGVAFAAWAATGDGAPHRPPPPPMGMMVPHGPMLDHVLDDVKASAAQRTQVHQIFDAAEADLKPTFPADRADHDQLRQLFSAPVVDAAARLDAQSRRVMQAFVDVSSVLTVDQRQAIAARMAAHEHGFGHPGHPASAASE